MKKRLNLLKESEECYVVRKSHWFVLFEDSYDSEQIALEEIAERFNIKLQWTDDMRSFKNLILVKAYLVGIEKDLKTFLEEVDS